MAMSSENRLNAVQTFTNAALRAGSVHRKKVNDLVQLYTGLYDEDLEVLMDFIHEELIKLIKN